jgi:hypothetical protein
VKLALVCMLAGCGRIGFGDNLPGPDAAPPDQTTATAGNFTFTDFSDCSQLVLRGNAMCIGGQLQLTSADIDQLGFAWVPQPYNLVALHDFAMVLRVSMQGFDLTGDGMTIILQSDPRGLDAVGITGGQLGISSIAPSTAIELDTFKDQVAGNTDPDYNHIGIDLDGDVDSVATIDPPFEMLTTGTFTIWLDYTATTQALAISIDPSTTKPASLFTVATDLSRLGSAAYLGLTGTTGDSYHTNGAISWSLVVD